MIDRIYIVMHNVSVKLNLDRFPLTAVIRKSIRRKLIASMIDVRHTPVKLSEGFSLYIDELDTLDLMVNREYEAEETKIIKRALKQGMIGLDIGANIGYYSILMAKKVQESLCV